MSKVRVFQRAFKEAIDLDRCEIKQLWNEPNAGWLDGGCFALAEALVQWAGLELAQPAAVRRGEQDVFDHAVVQIRFDDSATVYMLDGDGLTPRARFLYEWARNEYIRDDLILEPCCRVRLDKAAHADPVCDIAELVAHFHATLGYPSQYGFAPPGEVTVIEWPGPGPELTP